MSADQGRRSLGEKESRRGVSSRMTSPTDDHECVIVPHVISTRCHYAPAALSCMLYVSEKLFLCAHIHAERWCVCDLKSGSVLATGPSGALESLEVSAASCQRAVQCGE